MLAALSCDLVSAVLVITDDVRVAEQARECGAQVTPDVPRAGLNPALRHGVAVAQDLRHAAPVAALSGDLPALRPGELATALRAAGQLTAAFVADAEGTGTTLLTAAPGVELDPRFGHRSRARHVAAGVTELVEELVDGLVDGPLTSLRRDVDTEVDLYDARRLGLGPRTSQALALLHEPRAGTASPSG